MANEKRLTHRKVERTDEESIPPQAPHAERSPNPPKPKIVMGAVPKVKTPDNI